MNGEDSAKPAISLPNFSGPLDLLLQLVREEQLSIWDIPVARVCDQYQAALRRMDELDLEVAGEYLVCAAWLLLLKSRSLLPRRETGEEGDPQAELAARLLEYGKVKDVAAGLAGIEELRRGIAAVRLARGLGEVDEPELVLEDVDVLMLARAMTEVLERHRREHPSAMELEPLRFSVREKILALFELVSAQKSFPLLSHLLTRPSRLESVTWFLAGLELVRLGVAGVHQRKAFAEVYLRATGAPLVEEALTDA